MAQSPNSDSEGHFRLGPVSFTPTITVNNVGVDTNVFNDSEEPVQDFTATIAPAVDAMMRMGRARLSGSSSVGYVYFKDNADQRSLSQAHSVRLGLLLARLQPFVGGAYRNVRSRPNPEIDARLRQVGKEASAGVSLALGRKTEVIVQGRRTTTNYEDVTFDGENLRQVLNERIDVGSLSFRYTLTPLTTFVVRTEVQQDRFEFSSLRDANSVRVAPGFEFKPFALLVGSAFVGYRHFAPRDAQVPDYTGAVAGVDLTSTVRATKLGIQVNRDLAYSYQPEQPYFVLTGLGGAITQKITLKWDISGRIGHQWLDYQNLAGLDSTQPDRKEKVLTRGGGLGYQPAPSLHLGLNADYVRRRSSDVSTREYDGWRIGGSLNYGF